MSHFLGFVLKKQQQGASTPIFIQLNSSLETPVEGVLIKDESMLSSIEDAMSLNEKDEVFNARILRQNPFYVQIIARGEPGQVIHIKNDDIAKIYENFHLKFGPTEKGPFFDTIDEVEAWLEKNKRNADLKQALVENLEIPPMLPAGTRQKWQDGVKKSIEKAARARDKKYLRTKKN